MSNEPDPAAPGARRSAYVISIWAERQSPTRPVWRGCLETAAGGRRYFGTLAELGRLLNELGGWSDPQHRTEETQP